jgi:hypothetical protein
LRFNLEKAVGCAVTQEAKASEAENLSVHAVCEMFTSGQLLFLGLKHHHRQQMPSQPRFNQPNRRTPLAALLTLMKVLHTQGHS